MFNAFKTIPYYFKLSTDSMEIIRLDTGETAHGIAEHKFSNSRLVIANFQNAEHFAKSLLKELNGRHTFLTQMKIVMQQLEKCDGGLSTIEQRALRDLGERCGAKYVHLVNHDRVLDIQEARDLLS